MLVTDGYISEIALPYDGTRGQHDPVLPWLFPQDRFDFLFLPSIFGYMLRRY